MKFVSGVDAQREFMLQRSYPVTGRGLSCKESYHIFMADVGSIFGSVNETSHTFLDLGLRPSLLYKPKY